MQLNAELSANAEVRRRASPPAWPSCPSSAVPSPTGPPLFDRTQSSIDDAGSISVAVDVLRPLNPLDHSPADPVDVVGGRQMRAEAAALHQMFSDAARAGPRLDVDSAHRSYAYQQTFASGDARLGEAQTLRRIAKPGYSEHPTGLTADIGGGGVRDDPCFAPTAQGRWAAENAYRNGSVSGTRPAWRA